MIFVTGCARSGTTLITRMLEACGAELGEVGGLAENTSFKNNVSKSYLHGIGFDPLGQTPLPDTYSLPPFPDLRDKVLEVAGDAEIIKDVKTALMWPLLAEAFPDAKWVIVYRDPKKIAESCMRTRFMNRLHTEDEWEEWAHHYHGLCDDLAEAADAAYIVTADVIEDVENLREVVEWLGYDFDPDAVSRVINKSKWHGG